MTTARAFFDRTPLRALLPIPNAYLDQAMTIAYQLYGAGRYEDAETMCNGLVAADSGNWWAYSLRASILVKRGRTAEALAEVEAGLRHAPGQPKLVAMRALLLAPKAVNATITAALKEVA